MTDKEKIRAFIERRKESLKPCGGQGLVVTRLMRELCDDFLSFIDSMQKEEIPPKFPLISQKKCMYTKNDFTDEDRKVLCDGCEEECKYAHIEEPVSEELSETILEGTNFNKSWYAHPELAFKAGAKWQKEQMMANAFDFTEEHNTACVLASECLRVHGWFNRERDFNDLFRHISCVDELFEGKFRGKTKVIVIKEVEL